jgi:hypothetical protein
MGHGVLRQGGVVEVREDREVDESARFVAPGGGFQTTASSPILGAITMLPPLTPAQTDPSEGRRSASPDSRIQWAR